MSKKKQQEIFHYFFFYISRMNYFANDDMLEHMRCICINFLDCVYWKYYCNCPGVDILNYVAV